MADNYFKNAKSAPDYARIVTGHCSVIAFSCTDDPSFLWVSLGSSLSRLEPTNGAIPIWGSNVWRYAWKDGSYLPEIGVPTDAREPFLNFL